MTAPARFAERRRRRRESETRVACALEIDPRSAEYHCKPTSIYIYKTAAVTHYRAL